MIYGSRNLIGGLKIAAMNNLELHLAGLIKKGYVKHEVREGTDFYCRDEESKKEEHKEHFHKL